MNQLEGLKKALKLTGAAWLINATLFILSSFCFSWADHSESWSKDAWLVMRTCTIASKVILSIAIAFISLSVSELTPK